jgi:hypothetical protein
MTKKQYKDVDDSVASKIQQIQDLRRSGSYNLAAQKIKELNLKDYNFSAQDVNWLIEEIRNTQIYAKQKRQNIYTDDENPITSAINYDVWIGGE